MANNNNNHGNDFLFSEAPASWNTRYVDPNGFECQLTLHAETGKELLERSMELFPTCSKATANLTHTEETITRTIRLRNPMVMENNKTVILPGVLFTNVR